MSEKRENEVQRKLQRKLYPSGRGINTVMQEVQCNLREMGIDTGPGCELVLSWLYSLECRKEREGKPQRA